MFKSLSHVEFIFVYGGRVCSNFTDVAVQLSQYYVLETFSHCICLLSLSKNN